MSQIPNGAWNGSKVALENTVSLDNCGVTGELQNPVYFDIWIVDILNVVGHDDNFSRRPETPAEPASDADAVSDGETPS